MDQWIGLLISPLISPEHRACSTASQPTRTEQTCVDSGMTSLQDGTTQTAKPATLELYEISSTPMQKQHGSSEIGPYNESDLEMNEPA